jgi:GntR family transcriptional regulator of vanillate catabolism
MTRELTSEGETAIKHRIMSTHGPYPEAVEDYLVLDLAPHRALERGGSQTLKAYAALRDSILGGHLRPGERLSEQAMVQRLDVSRTPVRAALARLEEEGLLETRPSGGFAVRSFSESEVLAAIEIRGALEGLAARLAAERRPSRLELSELHACLTTIDRLIELSSDLADCFASYATLNARFHALIAALASSPALSRQLERALALPFASPSAFVMARSRVIALHTSLIVAQDQHHCVVEALEKGDGARAENVMREHARLTSRSLVRLLRNPEALRMVPGAILIRRDDSPVE